MTRAQSAPVLALTMGDPVGIGPEVVAKAVAAPDVRSACRPLVVGSPGVLQRAAQQSGVALEVRPVARAAEVVAEPGAVAVLDPTDSGVEDALLRLPLGHVSAEAGRASVAYVLAAIDLCLRREAAGMVTAPINKEAMNLGGFHYAGHTELLAERTGKREAAMMLITGSFRVAHVTTHVAFERVPALITAERLATVFELTWTTVRQLGVDRPRIAVAGLNPHAGEHGLFGNQEETIIAPAIRRHKNGAGTSAGRGRRIRSSPARSGGSSTPWWRCTTTRGTSRSR